MMEMKYFSRCRRRCTSELRNPWCTEASQGPLTSAIIQIVGSVCVSRLRRLTYKRVLEDGYGMKVSPLHCFVTSSCGHKNAVLSPWKLLYHNKMFNIWSIKRLDRESLPYIPQCRCLIPLHAS
jgi:hypothetical protein